MEDDLYGLTYGQFVLTNTIKGDCTILSCTVNGSNFRLRKVISSNEFTMNEKKVDLSLTIFSCSDDVISFDFSSCNIQETVKVVFNNGTTIENVYGRVVTIFPENCCNEFESIYVITTRRGLPLWSPVYNIDNVIIGIVIKKFNENAFYVGVPKATYEATTNDHDII